MRWSLSFEQRERSSKAKTDSMTNSARHLTAEVPCRHAKAEMTIGIDLGGYFQPSLRTARSMAGA